MKTNTTLPLAGQLQASEQWGYCTGYTNNKIPFPITFSTVHCVVSQMCAKGFAIGDGYGRHSHYVTTSGFQTVNAPSTSYPVAWIAIGKQAVGS